MAVLQTFLGHEGVNTLYWDQRRHKSLSCRNCPNCQAWKGPAEADYEQEIKGEAGLSQVAFQDEGTEPFFNLEADEAMGC